MGAVFVINKTQETIEIAPIYDVTSLSVKEPDNKSKDEGSLSFINRILELTDSGKDAQNGKKLDKLTIFPGEGIEISQQLLDLYDYQSLEASEAISIVAVEKTQPSSAFRYIINKTARRIGINTVQSGSKDQLIIPAFGARRILLTNLANYDYQSWEKLNLIRIEKEHTSPDPPLRWWWYIPGFWVIYGWLLVLLMEESLKLLVGLPNIGFWELYLGGAAGLSLAVLLIEFIFISNRGKTFRKVVARSLNLLAMLFVGPVGLPILVVVFFGGVFDILQQMDTINQNVALLARLIQLVLIVLLSALPGLLYFQFERRQVQALRTRFKRDIMQLNPWVHTEEDVEIMYGNLLDEVSISSGANARQFTMFAAGRPILMATLLITIAWIYTIWPVGDLAQNIELSTILAPRRDVFVFAFLGSYFFALNLIFRRYTRGDLTPKAYSHIMVRILSAFVIMWAISGLSSTTSNVLLISAFGIGIVPETGIALLRDRLLRSKMLADRFPSLVVNHPISELEGISLYDEARLLEEGIESVETLAHNNLIELLLRSGISTPRLVDLVDQAILYLHVTGKLNQKKELIFCVSRAFVRPPIYCALLKPWMTG